MKIQHEHEAKFYSQNGEDGVISTILAEIGDCQRTFIEIGTGDGTECNCMHLKKDLGWSGLFVDAAFENESIRKAFITKDNVQEVLLSYKAPRRPRVFSIDIDGNDFHVLKNVGPFLPDGVLVCEYNGHFKHDELAVMPYNPDWKWEGTRFYGASQAAMHRLGNELGYSLVYSNYVNLFFVSNKYRSHFEDADTRQLYKEPWSHLPDDRISLMNNPWGT